MWFWRTNLSQFKYKLVQRNLDYMYMKDGYKIVESYEVD